MSVSSINVREYKKDLEKVLLVSPIRFPKLNNKSFAELTEQEKYSYDALEYVANLYCKIEEKLSFYKLYNTDSKEDTIERERLERLRSDCWGFIWLRYCYVIGKKWNYANCGSVIENEMDLVDWLNSAISAGMYYRSWRPFRFDPKLGWIKNPQYKPEEKKGIDKSFNYFISSERGRRFQASNMQKRRANYATSSIDEDYEEKGSCVLDTDGLYTAPKNMISGPDGLVNYFVGQDKLISALIIEQIAYDTSTKVEDKVKHKFDLGQLMRCINKVRKEEDNNYIVNYFAKKYNITSYDKFIEDLRKMSSDKIKRIVQITLAEVRENKELLAFLM